MVSISPECFAGCPEVCQPLDTVISEYLASRDTVALQQRLCIFKDDFDCLFGPAVMTECVKVLSLGARMGVPLPMSSSEFSQSCATESAGSIGSTTHDGSTTLVHDHTTVVYMQPATTTSLTTSALENGTAPQNEADPAGSSSTAGLGDDGSTSSLEARSTQRATTTRAILATERATTTLALAAPEGPVNVCSGADSIASSAADVSSAWCSGRCPHLCESLEDLATAVAAGVDRDAFARQLCAAKGRIDCAFESRNVGVCRSTISAFGAFGMPQSQTDLIQQCSAFDRGVHISGAGGASWTSAAASLIFFSFTIPA